MVQAEAREESPLPPPATSGAGKADGPSLSELEAPAAESSESLIGSSSGTRTAEPDFTPGASSQGTGVALDELDELTIVARAQDGDPDAFDWLITAYQGGIYRLCFRMLADRRDAEDTVQETFIAAWRHLPKLSAPQAFIPWLYRTATNKCMDHLRKRKRRPSDAAEGLNEEVADNPGVPRVGAHSGKSRDPAQEFEDQAQIQALADLLQTLPIGPRACWLLREVHEFSYAEIAAIVQQPESTVRGRIARAKRMLAEGMEPWR